MAISAPSSRLEKAERRKATAEAVLAATRAEFMARRFRSANKAFAEIEDRGSKRRTIRDGKLFVNSYTTTASSRIRSGTTPTGGPADRHLDAYTLETQRALARELLRNSPIARGFLNRLSTMVLGGAGMWPQAMTDDHEWNKRAEDWFINDWWMRCDVTGKMSFALLQETLFKSCGADGDVLALKLRNGQIQVVEGERVRSPSAKRTGNEIINGVEIDSVGRPLRFYIAAGTTHGLKNRASLESRGARDCIFLVMPHMQWASQTRGEPLFVTALGKIDDIEEFIGSTVVAARMATFLSLIIHTENPGAMQDSMMGALAAAETGAQSDTEDDEQKEEIFGPGGVLHLRPNERVTQTKPEHPATGFDTFVRTLMRIVGMDLGLPYEVAALDFSVSNYYGNRAAMATAWQVIEKLQNWFQEAFLTPVYRWRIALAIEDGELPPNEHFRKVKWMAPTMPMVDPKAELEAIGLGIALGVKTERDGIEQLGGDQDEVHAQRAKELEAKRTLNIPTGTVQSVVPPRGPEPDGSAPDGQPKDEPKTEPKTEGKP